MFFHKEESDKTVSVKVKAWVRADVAEVDVDLKYTVSSVQITITKITMPLAESSHSPLVDIFAEYHSSWMCFIPSRRKFI